MLLTRFDRWRSDKAGQYPHSGTPSEFTRQEWERHWQWRAGMELNMYNRDVTEECCRSTLDWLSYCCVWSRPIPSIYICVSVYIYVCLTMFVTYLYLTYDPGGIHPTSHIDGISPYVILRFLGTNDSSDYWSMVDSCSIDPTKTSCQNTKLEHCLEAGLLIGLRKW